MDARISSTARFGELHSLVCSKTDTTIARRRVRRIDAVRTLIPRQALPKSTPRLNTFSLRHMRLVKTRGLVHTLRSEEQPPACHACPRAHHHS